MSTLGNLKKQVLLTIKKLEAEHNYLDIATG